jgi:hypothetical protein
MWACDEYQFAHPRARLQLAFSVMLMTLLGSRLGEFIESAAWKHSNEGLLYSNIDLVRYMNSTYMGFPLHLRLRNRKGHRNNKKVPVDEWALLPAKLQLPAFRVHRCHHQGVERGGEQEAFELPFGFPEVVQHMHNIPPNVGPSRDLSSRAHSN